MAFGATEPVEVHRARSLPEAHALRLALEREGIPVFVDNEMLQGAVGELPAGWATAPRLLVAPEHADAARALLAQFLRPAAEPDEGGLTPESCLACGALMGDADACPKCGWTYAPEGTAADEGPERVDETSPSPAVSSPAVEGPALPRRAVWAELAAVLAVGVIPNLTAALAGTDLPQAGENFRLAALSLISLSLCTAFVTLYLIGRSGEPWARFGLARPQWRDLPLGLVMLFAGQAIYLFRCGLVPAGVTAASVSAPEPGRVVLLVLMHAANALAEEVVTRAYLVTRLAQLSGSRGVAVVTAAAAFASYHVYQGLAGATLAFAMGLVYGVGFLVLRRVWPLVIGHALLNLCIEFGVRN
jgi:membrane protease YdiL (CAAX protease family)